MSKENFCNWGDARTFMNDCFRVGGLNIPAQRQVIEVAQRLESPLELVMLSALSASARHLELLEGQNAGIVRELIGDHHIKFDLQSAVPIGMYRADLVARMISKLDELPTPTVVVECDGFTYHDAVRDLAIRDRVRDRYMQRKGYVVARFLGEEIVEHPFACAFEVYALTLRNIVEVNLDKSPPGGWPVFTRSRDTGIVGPPSLRQFDISPESLTTPSLADEVMAK